MSVRPPAVAGFFYPGDPVILKNTVQNLLDQARQYTPAPKALVVPHAGLIYSGPVAASAYASLLKNKDTINKIVLLGPAHKMYFKGIAYDPVDHFATPLGEIEQDKDLLAQITDLPFVHALPEAHRQEHCLEVQWPFCQMIFPKFKMLPLVVGEANEQDVATVLERIWGDEHTLIIISSDLSHYLSYEVAQQTDSRTCLSIDTLDGESIPHHGACGYYPLRGFLHYARQNNICGRMLDLRNSGDTAGTKEKVVGYTSYHFYQNLSFGTHCGDELLTLAKETIRLKDEENKSLAIDYNDYNGLTQIRIPTFVTLKKNGMLRGCMGSLRSQERLAENIIHNATNAGFADPRFPKLAPNELNDISLSISILSPLATMKFNSEEDLKAQLQPGIDGLLLICGHHQATFLPSVWDSLSSKDLFVQHLKLKMGLTADFWSTDMKALRYTTEIIE